MMTTPQPSAPLEPEVEQAFDEFWRPIVMPNGEWDFDQVKRELHDCRIYISEVPKVYDEITQGAISKPHTLASAVIGVHDERCWYAQDAQRIRSAAEAVIDEWDTRGDGGCSRSIRDALREALDG